MGLTVVEMSLFDDANCVESVWEFFRNSQSDFENMMEKLNAHSDEMSVQTNTVLFPILGNIHHHFSEVAKENIGLKLEEQISLKTCIEDCQTLVISDPNFEQSIRLILPNFIANQILNQGE